MSFRDESWGVCVCVELRSCFVLDWVMEVIFLF